MIIRRPWFAALLALLACIPNLAAANDPGADGLFGRDVRGAVALKGRLWAHGYGALAWFDLTTGVRHVEIPNGVLDLARWNGEVWALRRRADLAAPSPDHSRYSAYYLRGGALVELPPLTARTAGGPLNLAMSAAGPRFVGAASVWTLARGANRWGERRIRWPKGAAPAGYAAVAASMDGRSLYLIAKGAPRGGPLLRVDPASGRASVLGKAAMAALTPDPNKPGCVIAAYADGPGTSSGDLARVCGDTVTKIEFRPDVLNTTEPIIGLAAEGDVIWAMGAAGLYKLVGSTRVRFSLTAWTTLADREVSRPAPGALVVLSDLGPNGRLPLVVAAP